jgi:hypothetical protein
VSQSFGYIPKSGIQGITFTKQMLNHLHLAPALFALVILEIRSHFLPRSFYFILCAVTEMTGAYHHTQLFAIEMESHKLFAYSGLKPQSLCSKLPR